MAGRDLVLIQNIWIASLRLDNPGIEKSQRRWKWMCYGS